MAEQFVYWTIAVDGVVIGGEFGRMPSEAIERYAAGSIYPASKMKALRGKVGVVGKPLEITRANGEQVR